MTAVFIKSHLHSQKWREALYGNFFPGETLELPQVPIPREGLAGEKQDEPQQPQGSQGRTRRRKLNSLLQQISAKAWISASYIAPRCSPLMIKLIAICFLMFPLTFWIFKYWSRWEQPQPASSQRQQWLQVYIRVYPSCDLKPVASSLPSPPDRALSLEISPPRVSSRHRL